VVALLGPVEGGREWLVPAAAAYLCVPFFLTSVLVESLVARKALKEVEPSAVRRWAWCANGFSYAIAFVCLVILAIASAVRQRQP
jgi:hypothetical protein